MNDEMVMADLDDSEISLLESYGSRRVVETGSI
jgi:hypothetical protein